MFLTKPIWGMLIRSLRSINPHLGNGSPEPPEYQSPPGEWHFGASRVPIPTWGMAFRSLRSINPHLGNGISEPPEYQSPPGGWLPPTLRSSNIHLGIRLRRLGKPARAKVRLFIGISCRCPRIFFNYSSVSVFSSTTGLSP